MANGTARDSHQTAAEMVIARSVAVFVVAMALQSLGQAVSQTPDLAWWWTTTITGGLLVSAGWLVVAGIRGDCRRPALTLFAGSAAAGLALWPMAYAADAGPPWVWNVLGVAVAAAAAGWGTPAALAYLGGVAVLFVVIRMTPSGGSAGYVTALQDAIFLVVAGVALTAAIQAMRVGARRADASAMAADEAYVLSARARGRLVERHRLAAILHDCVLAALVAAAHAETAEERHAAARLARDSLGRLSDLSTPVPDQLVPLDELPDRLRSTAAAASAVAVRVHVPPDLDHGLVLSGAAEEALLGATYAALDNASRHSGSGHATVRLGYDDASQRVWVEVRDGGRGFDPESVSERCLGIRLSIHQRMRDVGGAALVTSSVGAGTDVVLAVPAVMDVSA